MRASPNTQEDCANKWKKCVPKFFHFLAFLMIVKIEAAADSIKQIHWAAGGTSGIKEATKNTTLVAAPINIPDGDAECIILYVNKPRKMKQS